MTEENTPYILTDQQRQKVLARQLLNSGQFALLLDDGSITVMDSNRQVQISLDANAIYSLLDLLYNRRNLLHNLSYQAEQD